MQKENDISNPLMTCFIVVEKNVSGFFFFFSFRMDKIDRETPTVVLFSCKLQMCSTISKVFAFTALNCVTCLFGITANSLVECYNQGF